MTSLIVHHKVENYDQWKAVFDEMIPLRQSFGSTGATILRGTSDPNEIVIITTWPSAQNAQGYAQSPELKTGMQRAGVVSRPDAYIVDEADHTSA